MGKRNHSKDLSHSCNNSRHYLSSDKHEPKLQAVILADNFNTSFDPITLDTSTPKVLCPLNNVAIIDYSIEFLIGAGVEELFVFCVNGGTEVESYLSSSRWTRSIYIQCVIDPLVTNAGDALRELDKRQCLISDPFLLMNGDVVTNADVGLALMEHKRLRKKQNNAILTLLLKRLGGWNAYNREYNLSSSPLRSLTNDLTLALGSLDSSVMSRVLLYDSQPHRNDVALPTSFFNTHSIVKLRNDLLDTGIYICSPEVLARFSDEFDYLSIFKFISNAVLEEEVGLQSRVHAYLLPDSEYAARIHDPRTYHAVSSDLLRRWCHPLVPENFPSGYDRLYRYEMERSHRGMYMYMEKKGNETKVGRSGTIVGPGMIGSGCVVGEECEIQGTVIGNNCRISDNVIITDSHIWENVTVKQNVTIIKSILCNHSSIHEGAVVSKGCIIGSKCVVGKDVVLSEFMRVTLCKEEKDVSNEFYDFENLKDDDKGEEFIGSKESSNVLGERTDYDVLGKDGRGRVWAPTSISECEYDDYHYSNDNNCDIDACYNMITMKALEKMKSESIGYEPNESFKNKFLMQMEEGDSLSDNDDETVSSFSIGSLDNILIPGRQRGVDVIKELKAICSEYDTSCSIENILIELNSFKFSQNASFGDCASGAVLAFLERIPFEDRMSPVKLVGYLKKELTHWKSLFHKLCHGYEEEISILRSLESAALGTGTVGNVLQRAPSFRVLLQTFHEEDIISEDTILSWACERKCVDVKSSIGKLFFQERTQEFLAWLAEDSESSSDQMSSDISEKD